MTDGPFKNSKLDSNWKRFAEALQNDSVDVTERNSLAAHAFVHEILDRSTQALLGSLRAYLTREQLDLDPLSSTENIFNQQSRTAFSDTYQKELSCRLYDQVPSIDAFKLAMYATVNVLMTIARSRIEEECIRVHDSGEMPTYQLEKTVEKVRSVFSSLPTNDICDAIYKGNRNAFESEVSRKTSLDDGPTL